jgi:hypothetical protein
MKVEKRSNGMAWMRWRGGCRWEVFRGGRALAMLFDIAKALIMVKLLCQPDHKWTSGVRQLR